MTGVLKALMAALQPKSKSKSKSKKQGGKK